ncbi:MAG TPA: AIPR family protein [Verrucomicrobiales bacterium]|nr:AIPR family protein [Verrucomicrobiales bacterium]
MTGAQLAILKTKLTNEFVPELPPLLDLTPPADHRTNKNISRAFNAYAIQKITGVDTATAAKSVVDDYQDNGIDAIYYHQPSKKLFLVQGKLKTDEPFSQQEANAFVKGVRDLLNEHYDRFNKNVQDRQAEIDAALAEAAEIVLVTARTAELLSQHAIDAINQFITDAGKPDERLVPAFIEFGPVDVVESLLDEKAVPTVDDELVIFGHQRIDAPRLTYYGQVSLSALAALHTKHGNALFEKNIRYSLGVGKSDVNRAILGTLVTAPANFFFLSNGVTAIANSIEPKGIRDGGRRFELRGLSVINGAQTIATSHHFIAANPHADVASARVLLTLIRVDEDDPFSTEITRARNHQNPVSAAQFAALDGIQERLRRELLFHNIVYRYRPEGEAMAPGLDAMTIEDASVALGLIHGDPGMPVMLKREPGKLLDTKGAEYGRLFLADLSGCRLANAVRLYRCASSLVGLSEIAAYGQEKLIYRHGRHAIMWLTPQQSRLACSGHSNDNSGSECTPERSAGRMEGKSSSWGSGGYGGRR